MVIKQKPSQYLAESYVPTDSVPKCVAGSSPALSWTSIAGEFAARADWFGACSHENYAQAFTSFNTIQFDLTNPRLEVICRPRLGKFGKASPGIQKITLSTD